MSVASDIVLVGAFISVVFGVSGVAFQIARTPMLERPRLGARGVERRRALETSGVFMIVEPAIRFVGSWFQHVPSNDLRVSVRRALTQAGEYLGLSADELFGIAALSALLLGASAAAASSLLGFPWGLVPIACLLGAIAPWLRVQAIGRDRARTVNRSLPSVLELAAMCMSAGLDFPGSLRRIVSSAPDSREPIIEELARVLRELDLGHTRRSALQRLAVRIPTDQVRELANAIVQAEDKGSPLGPVLAIQAQTQRLRRSIAAEELASDAALMLIGPMTLIFLCVIVLLLGPVVVRLMTGGLGVS